MRHIFQIKVLNKRLSGKTLVFLFTWIGFPLSIVAQEIPDSINSKIDTLVDYTDNYYGTDDRLINGEVYMRKYTGIKGSPYLFDEKWINGNLFLKGKAYKDRSININLETGELILNAELKEGTFTRIVLNDAYLDSIDVSGRRFVNSVDYFPADSSSTYFEIIYKNEFVYVVHYKKEFLREYTDSTPLGRYSGLKADKAIIIKGEKINVNRKKAFLNFFGPDNKKAIHAFMKKNQIKYKKADSYKLQKLLAFCGTLYYE